MLELAGRKVVLREFTAEHLNDPKYFAWLRDLETVLPIYRIEYLLPLTFDALRAYVESLWKDGRDAFFAIHRGWAARHSAGRPYRLAQRRRRLGYSHRRPKLPGAWLCHRCHPYGLALAPSAP